MSMSSQKLQNFKVIISEDTLKKAEEYKQELLQGKKAGDLFGEKLAAKTLQTISTEAFISALIKTKSPMIFAESSINGDGKDWNQKELSILGDINITVPVTIFDNGAHYDPTPHAQPFSGTLLFTPGALLRNDQGGTTPDMTEVVKNNQINREAFYNLYERRILPLLVSANISAGEKGKQALVTIPGIGCGMFAGKFRGQLGRELQNVLEKIIQKHGKDLKNIKAVYYDPYDECENERKKIEEIDLMVRPLLKTPDGKPKRSQLCPPEQYQEDGDNFSNCELFSLVAWDQASWPGNDYYEGSRATDDGVKAAATSSMQSMTGVQGEYDKESGMYLPPGDYVNWNAVIDSLKIELNTEGKIFVAVNGNLQRLHNNRLIPLVSSSLSQSSLIATLSSASSSPASARIKDHIVTPDMAGAFYIAGNDMGKGKELLGLTNEHEPEKFSKALDILGITPENVNFNGRDGYVVSLNNEQFQKIEKICNPHGKASSLHM